MANLEGAGEAILTDLKGVDSSKMRFIALYLSRGKKRRNFCFKMSLMSKMSSMLISGGHLKSSKFTNPLCLILILLVQS